MKKLAKIVRGVTVPPIMVSLFLLFLYFFRDDVLTNIPDLCFSLLFLAILPVLAYPLQATIPAFRPGGQKMKRKLAFVLSLVGYTAALIVSLLRDAVPNLAYIDAVYLCSVVVLTLINLLTPWHASGHACSLVGPAVMICFFIGWPAVVPALLLTALSFWASVYLKRHTPREFLLGALSSSLSILLMYLIFQPVF